MKGIQPVFKACQGSVTFHILHVQIWLSRHKVTSLVRGLISFQINLYLLEKTNLHLQSMLDPLASAIMIISLYTQVVILVQGFHLPFSVYKKEKKRGIYTTTKPFRSKTKTKVWNNKWKQIFIFTHSGNRSKSIWILNSTPIKNAHMGWYHCWPDSWLLNKDEAEEFSKHTLISEIQTT